MISQIRGRLLSVCLFSLSAVAGAQGAKAPAQSPKQDTLHIARSSILSNDHGTRTYVVWGQVGSEKVELITFYSGYQRTWVLKPGDYPITLKKEDASDGKLSRTYAVEVSPGTTVSFDLAGLEE